MRDIRSNGGTVQPKAGHLVTLIPSDILYRPTVPIITIYISNNNSLAEGGFRYFTFRIYCPQRGGGLLLGGITGSLGHSEGIL